MKHNWLWVYNCSSWWWPHRDSLYYSLTFVYVWNFTQVKIKILKKKVQPMIPKEDPEICSKTIVLNGWLWWEEKKFPRSQGFSWHIKSKCRVLNTEVYPKSKVMSFPNMIYVPASPRKAWKKPSKWKTGKGWRVRRVENLYSKSQRVLRVDTSWKFWWWLHKAGQKGLRSRISLSCLLPLFGQISCF